MSIDAERVQLWLRRGARPSDSARQLLVNEGILQARPFKATPKTEAARKSQSKTPKNGAAAGATDTALASGATEAGDVAGGSAAATDKEPTGGAPETAGPAKLSPLARKRGGSRAEEPAE